MGWGWEKERERVVENVSREVMRAGRGGSGRNGEGRREERMGGTRNRN